MRSFVLWYKKRDAQIEDKKIKAELDLHINLWKNQKRGKEETFFNRCYLQ